MLDTDTDTMTAPARGVTVDERVDVAPAEPGDHERLAHYVAKRKITDSAVFGTPLTALCGKTWVPTRDPKKFPVCPECKDLLDKHWPEPERPTGDA